MISYLEAKRLIKKNLPVLQTARVLVGEAVGCVLAQDVKAPHPLPLMDQSAMDGFVFRSQDTRRASLHRPVKLGIKGTVKAGDGQRRVLRRGEAYRMMTGGPLMQGADTVMMKEKATICKGHLMVTQSVAQGCHVRYRGEEVRKGTRVLLKGEEVHPGTVAVLATFGMKYVKVFKKPRVSVIATGSELVSPGVRIRRGKIYDSNSWMIQTAVQSMGLDVVYKKTLPDRPALIRRAIQRALRTSDVVVLNGGVSVGDYDYVKSILKQLGVRTLFWKVDQKPGKPMFFGKKGRTLVVGLPGNPASSYICFYEYVYEALRGMSGFKNSGLQREKVFVKGRLPKSTRRMLFLKGRLARSAKGISAMTLPHQGSHMVTSLHQANSLILVPADLNRLKGNGHWVLADLLPHSKGRG